MKYKHISAAVIGVLVLVGCHSNEVAVPSEEVTAPSIDKNLRIDYNYSFGVEHDQDESGLVQVDYSVDNEGAAISVGLMAFVNGIPQQVTGSDGEASYIITEQISENNKADFKY